MGYLNGFVKGTLVGTVLGLCIAPQTGGETRDQLKRLRAGARLGAEDARRHVPATADPTVARAWDGAASVLGTVDGSVTR